MTSSPVVPTMVLVTLLSGCTLVRGVPPGPTPQTGAAPSARVGAAADLSDPASRAERGEIDTPVETTYQIGDESYDVWADADGYVDRGIASWYGPELEGQPTASGEPFDPYAMTAAHKNLPLGTRVEVENLENGRSVIVRVNDRGPFVDGRVIDLSLAAAQALGFAAKGTARVRVRALD